MTQITFVENKKNNIDLVLIPIKNNNTVNEATVRDLIKTSGYKTLQTHSSNLKNAIAELNIVLKTLPTNKQGREIRYQILERKNASIVIKIDNDQMSAFAEITTAIGGKNPSVKEIYSKAQLEGVIKGFSKKALLDLAQRLVKEPEGTLIKGKVANGKMPINGKNAQIKQLVQSAQDRVLKPKELDDGSVDMKDLGDIVCVRVGDPLVQRIPLTEGIKGYTVTGTELKPKPGEDIKMNIGDGTAISPHNKNVLISTLVGLPRAIKNGMRIDEIYKLKNVDVSTGHIKFEGSIVIDGDVCEGMIVNATGNITIGGYVESAHIEAGGDIIVSGGIIGKKQESEDLPINKTIMSAELKTSGNIFAKYCQYANISCNKLKIETQLMHSIVHVNDSVWVGSADKADGKLIAGYTNAVNSVQAGIVGATAGNSTIITFNKRINELKIQLTDIDKRLTTETEKTQELKSATDKLKVLPKEKSNIQMLKNVISSYQFHAEQMGNMLLEKENKNTEIQDYLCNVSLEATEKIYQNVQLNVGDFTGSTKREFGPSKMVYHEREIHVEPIINT